MSLCSLLGAFEHRLSCSHSHCARTFHGEREAADILPTAYRQTWVLLLLS